MTSTTQIVVINTPNKPIVQPPALKDDAERQPHARTILERRIVWNLLEQLVAADFEIVDVYDGEEAVKCADNLAALETVFSVDDSRIYCKKKGVERGERNVLIVLGNGEDCISDWSFLDGDADGFDAFMNAFTSEDNIAAML